MGIAFLIEKWRPLLPEWVRFGFVGAANTLATLSVIWGLLLASVDVRLANFVGYAVGMSISFTLNRAWTFSCKDRARAAEVVRFLFASGVAYLCNLGLVSVTIGLGVSPYLAQLVGIPAYTICFYLMSRYFVFTNRGQQ
jgi:putative flippase GtrA